MADADEPVEDRVHRIRRALIVVMFAAPLAAIAAMFALDTAGWLPLLLSELAPGVSLPTRARPILFMVEYAAVLVPAVVAAAAAVAPYDRRLRDTEQSTAAGVGQTLRVLALGVLPVGVWLIGINLLADGLGPWAIAPLALLFFTATVVLGPLLLNRVLTTRPLDEDLWARVLAMCADQGLRVRDAREIDSRGGKVANAAISDVIRSCATCT